MNIKVQWTGIFHPKLWWGKRKIWRKKWKEQGRTSLMLVLASAEVERCQNTRPSQKRKPNNNCNWNLFCSRAKMTRRKFYVKLKTEKHQQTKPKKLVSFHWTLAYANVVILEKCLFVVSDWGHISAGHWPAVVRQGKALGRAQSAENICGNNINMSKGRSPTDYFYKTTFGPHPPDMVFVKRDYATDVSFCQTIYANHDNSKFARKLCKYLNLTTNHTFCAKVAQQFLQYL